MLAPASAGVQHIESIPASSDEAPESSTSESILLVEDDDAVRRGVRRILTRAGYRVVEARDGFEAIAEYEEIDEANLDMLLTDVVMPGMSGGELAEKLLQRQPELKVLYMTGYAAKPQLARLGLDGDRALLPKPFREERLLSMVREVLDSDDFRSSVKPTKGGVEP
jgi:CheY-like chemotaxis protein